MSGGEGCGGGGKWPCRQCTYLNYSISARCTMCGFKRPQQQQHLHIIPPTSISTSIASTTVMEPATTQQEEKWACSQCTYLNYPRSIRCTQCYSSVYTPAPADQQPRSSTSEGKELSTQHGMGARTHKSNNMPQQSPKSVASPVQSSAHSPQSLLSQQSQLPLSPVQQPGYKFSHSLIHNIPRSPPPLSKPPHSTTTESSSHNFGQSPLPKCPNSSPPKSSHLPLPVSRASLPKSQSPVPKSHSPVSKSPNPSSPKSPHSPHLISKSSQLKTNQSPPIRSHDASPYKFKNLSPNSQCCKQASVQMQKPSAITSGSYETHEQQISSNTNQQILQQYQPDQLQSHKWCCLACTYKNWPRTTKCIMCGTSKTYSAARRTETCASASPIIDSSATTTQVESYHLDDSMQTNARTNTPEKRANKMDTEHQNILNESQESKMCESINIINRNRSEHCLTQESNQHTSSSSPQLEVSSIIGHGTASVTTTISPSSPIISCPTTHTSSSTLSAMHASPNYNMGQASNRDCSGDSGVRGRDGGVMALNNYETERLLRQLRRRLREADWAWLNACLAVVEGNYEPVENYLSTGGDPMRQLTSADIKLLARPSAFDEGHTLVHLAIRFGREDLLDTILSGLDGGGGGGGVKRVPCYVAPELAAIIRRGIAASLRQRRGAGTFPCYCVSEIVTFSLPPEVEGLGSAGAQERLWDELLDRDAQKQLEEDAPIINWSLELTERLGSRLYALWNRTAGDCLLDSVLQATWGVFDRDNCLRRALAASITDAAHHFYPRWRDYEQLQATQLDYAVPENQVLQEWAEMVCLASQPGAALDQLHIFILAHVLRRPIIVYGVKCVKSFRGEDLGYARFEGVYLPLLWDSSFCCKSPVALGYTRGHFCALVPICPPPQPTAGAILEPGDAQLVFLPLMTHDAKLLSVHFITQPEVGCEAGLLREWLEVCQSDTGLLVAQQRLHKKPLHVAQMTEEWLNYYRRMAQMESAPFSRPITTQGYSSDGDSEEE